MRRRKLIAGSLALVTAVAVSGCAPVFEWLASYADIEPSTPTGESGPEGFERYYAQSAVWEWCDTGLYCATVDAPLDWSNSEAGDIELALAIRPATEPTHGSLFVNPGGPGASGVALVAGDVSGFLSDEVQATYDIVGWDPRGVGQSTPVTCAQSDEELDGYLFGEPGTESSDVTDADLRASAREFVDSCIDNTGELIRHLDTITTARDLDMLRAIVGDTHLNYLGMSYGTEIGSEYLRLFDENVGHMILDGVVDPTATAEDMILAQARGFENAFVDYLDSCDSGQCELFASRADLESAMERITALAESEQHVSSDGRTFTSAVLRIAIAANLYDEGLWGALDDVLDPTVDSDETVNRAFAVADEYYGRDSDGTYSGQNAIEAFVAVSCADYGGVVEPDRVAALQAEMLEVAPLTGARNLVPDYMCAFWPTEPTRSFTPVSAPDSPDILVVGTTGDPATPFEGAEAVAAQLEHGVLVSVWGTNHVAAGRNTCVIGAYDRYLLEGIARSASC